jgi:peptidoglycan/xylan/chitin deacetylase (PgdA/CDA1 family)
MPALEERIDRWREAADAGHEIGNHSLRHPCSANFRWKTADVLEHYTLPTIEAELLEANRRLAERFGAPPRTFAYPCGQDFVGVGAERRSYVPVVARHFLAGRGFRDEYLNAPEVCDLARLGGTELDGESAEEMLSAVARAASGGQWLVWVGHDVGPGGRQTTLVDALDQFCAHCADPTNGVWIDTVANVAAYVAARRR